MGVDWEISVRIYSENTSDLDTIQQNFHTYFHPGDDLHGSVYRLPHSLNYAIDQPRGDVYLGECEKIVRDFPGCFIRATWAGDCNAGGDYVCYMENGNPRGRYLHYPCSHLDFWRYIGHDGIVPVEENTPNNSLEYIKENYAPGEGQDYFWLTLQMTECDVEKVLQLLKQEEPNVEEFLQSKTTHSEYFFYRLFCPTRMYDTLQKTIQAEEGYLFSEWHTEDGKRSGMWVGSHEKDYVVTKLFEYPSPPQLYTVWKDERLQQRIDLTTQITAQYEADRVERQRKAEEDRAARLAAAAKRVKKTFIKGEHCNTEIVETDEEEC